MCCVVHPTIFPRKFPFFVLWVSYYKNCIIASTKSGKVLPFCVIPTPSSQTAVNINSMLFYPFKSQFLKTSLNRNQVAENLVDQTFLSDAEFKRTNDQPRLFYGEVSSQDFTLETIAQNKALVNFCTGEIRGSENEIYVLIQLGAWQHRRIFLLFVLLILACFVFLINHLVLFKAIYPQTIPAWLLLMTLVALFTTLYTKARSFQRSKASTIAHFCTLWKAEPVTKNQVPLIFR